jgi:major membrane immunogen (membrane-anchored lipoprotein)
MNLRRTALIVTALFTTGILAACGSSNSSTSSQSDDAQDDTSSDIGNDNSDSTDSSDNFNGTGSVTVGDTTYNFKLQCAFGAATANEEVSISIKGTGDDGIEMAFTQMWGVDLASGKMSPDTPPNQSLAMYTMPGIVLVHEFLSLSDKLVNVSGTTVSGPAMFYEFDENGEPTDAIRPTLPGEINLNCN